jgi:uncharacterized repeat protein (TIGR01451 family)
MNKIPTAMKSIRIFVLAALLAALGLQILIPAQPAKADVVAGFSEYYIPGGAEQVLAILKNNQTNITDTNMHNVITLPITTPNLTIYYDHWENGYSTGAAGDEVYSGYAVGTVLTFESPTIPASPRGTGMNVCAGSTNPNGATTACYDGRDRIFIVGGAVSLAQAFWPSSTGTVYANAWEIYPIKALQTSYVMPVWENLFDSYSSTSSYADFDNVYVLVQATQDGTSVSITNPGGTALPATSLNRGQVTQLYHIMNAGATISANYPVQVQFILGRQNASYDSRSHTLVPSAQWDKQYYSPVPSNTSGGLGTANVNIYMYNPTGSPLAVTYQDTTGSVTCNIAAGNTMSTKACTGRFVPQGSGVYLSAASNFFAIGEYDTGSATRNWGFSIIPVRNLSSEYYVPWAPGTDQASPTANGSPVFVTPTVNGQVIKVDYSPTNGTVDATYTLNKLVAQKILDPDNVNTGMHLWSDYPFAITWGEDAQYSQTGSPYIDAGYTILPPNPEWITIALGLVKSANPEVIVNQVGETVEFTLQVTTGAYAISNVYVTDLLPPYFQYVTGSTTITWPGGSSTADPGITGAAATGYTLRWPSGSGSITNLAANQTLTVKFSAITVTGFNSTSSVNNATVTGTWNTIPITATGQATVIAGTPAIIRVIKDAVPNDPQDFNFTLIDQARPTHPTNFTLDDDSDPTYVNTAQYSVKAGTYSVSESAVTGWDQTSATCISSNAGKTPTPANIVLDAGETVTCTFTNTKQNPHLNLTKTATETSFNAAGVALHYTLVATNDGNVNLTNVSITDAKLGTLSCNPAQPATLAPAAKLTCTGTYITTQADVNAGRVDNTANASGLFGTTPVNSKPATATVYGTPTIAKAFSPATITAGGTSTITFTLTNSRPSVLTNASFRDTLSGMAISGAQNAGGTCAGASSNSFTNGATILSLGGITIPPSGSCTVTVVVTSSSLGTNPNATSGVTTDQTTVGSPSTEVNLTVLGKATIAKAFDPATIPAGGTSTITFTLTNPNASALTNASFNDTLSGMAISGAQNAGGTCAGASGNSFANGVTNLSFSGITIPASGSCTVTVMVTSSSLGTHPNATSGVTTNQTTVGSPSDLANLTVLAKPVIAKAFSPASVYRDDVTTLTFTITNPNAGNALSGVAFADTYPAGLVTNTPPGIVNTCAGTATASAGGNSISLSGGTIPANSSCTVSVDIKATAAGTFNNTSGAVTADYTGAGNTASDTLTVTEVPDLAITKTDGLSLVVSGQTINYTMNITNEGIATAATVTLDDTLSANLTYKSFSCLVGSAGTSTPPTYTWNLGDLAAGASTTCTLTAKVADGLSDGTSVSNYAHVSTPTYEPNITNNEASDIDTVNASYVPDLQVTKTDGQTTVLAGDTLTYTITYKNVGLAATTGEGVKITDTLPANTAFVNADNGGSYDSNTGKITWILPNLGVNVSGSVNMTVTVNSNLLAGAVVLNHVSIASITNPLIDNNLADNSATDSDVIVAPYIVIEKSVTGSPTVGSELTYSIHWQNISTADAASVVITDTLPAHTTFVSADNGGSYNSVTGKITWNLGLKAPGTSGTVSFKVTVEVGAGGALQTSPTLSTESSAGSVSVVSKTTAYSSLPWCDSAFNPKCLTFRGIYQGANSIPPAGWNDNPRATVFDDTSWSQPVPPAVPDVPGHDSTNGVDTGVEPYWMISSDLSANWVTMHTNGETAGNYSFFRQAFCLPLNATNQDASLSLSGDDTSTIYLNGVAIGQQTGAGAYATFAGASSIQSGINLLAVQLLNNTHGGHAIYNYADHSGLLFNLQVSYSSLRPFAYGPTMLVAGQTASFTIDENALGGRTPYYYKIDFGDGTSAAYQPGITFTHPYSSAGVYVATVTARAQYGCTGTDQVTINVLPAGNQILANTANVTYQNSKGTPFTGQSGVGLAQAPALTLDKTTSTTTYATVGDTISYSYKLTNSGNVSLSGPFSVTDDHIGTPHGTEFTCGSGPLAPNAFTTCTKTYAVTQEDLDAGSVTNAATAHTSFNGVPYNSNADTVTVNADQNPGLSLTKTADPTTYNTVNQTITYHYVIKNSGNATLTGPFSVADDKASVTCTQPVDGKLSPNEEMNCSASYKITQTDLDSGSVKNTATASGGGVTSSEDSATVTAIQTKTLSLTKTTDPETYRAVGEVIHYTFTIQNTGNVTLAGPFSVNDNKLGTLTNCAAGPLAPGMTVTCTANHTITQADLDAGSISNSATASGNGVTSNQGTATVTAIQSPSLSLTKSGELDMTIVAPVDRADAGDKINYTLTATNDGNVTLTGVVIVDTKLGTLACTPAQSASLAPGAALVCRGSYTLTQTDINAGTVHNVATGDSDQTNPTDTPNDVLVPAAPALSLVKAATPATYDHVGQVINYSYEVKNTGNVTLAGPVTVADDKATVTCPAVPAGGLVPGASITCTASYTIKQSDLDYGSVKNTAKASANGTDSNTATTTVTAVQSPALSLVKAATPATYDHVGQTINYSYVVKNTGNVTLAGPVTVADDKTTVTCPATPAGGLVPGASITCTASYTIKQSDLDSGSVKNTAKASANGTDSNTASTTVNAIQSPALSLVKTATPATYSAVGDLISYIYVLKNTGNVTLSSPFGVTDDKIVTPSVATCPQPATLAVGDNLTCTATYHITQADLDAGTVVNHATGTAKFGTNTVTSNQATATVTAVQAPAITLTKSANPVTYGSTSDVIVYTYVVQNTGNVTLPGPFSISDDKLGTIACPAGSLAPYASVTCTATHTITQADLDGGSIVNHATASTTYHTNPVNSNQATATVSANQVPHITVTKTPDRPSYSKVGDVIHYTLVATNDGNVTLSNVSISDPKLGTLACNPSQPTTLAPSATLTCTGSHTVILVDLNAGTYDNTATANGTGPAGQAVSDTDNASVPAVREPHLLLTKSGEPKTYDTLNQTITYTLVATNDGNVTLHNVSISDASLGTLTCNPSQPASLNPGDSLSCTGSRTVTQADLDGGPLVNTAHASGLDPTNTTVNAAPASETINPDRNPHITLTKGTTTEVFDHVNQVINYTLVATNDGNVTLSNVSISDPKLGALACTPTQPATLAPGATLSCTGSHTVTQADLDAGKYDNTATVTGKDPQNQTISDTASASVPAMQNPLMSLTKAATESNFNAVGDVIHYTLVATNTGNVTLHAVSISDAMFVSLNCTPSQPATLAPGASLSCTGSHTVTLADLNAGSVVNTANAAGTPPTGTPIAPPPAEVTVPAIQNPHITLTKGTTTTTFDHAGQVIDYTLVATNDGNVTISNVTINDPSLGALTCTQPVTLAPGATLTCTGSHTVTQGDLNAGKYDNTATVNGSGPAGQPVSDEASQSVPASQTPHLSLTKDADRMTYDAINQVITYTLVATNDGNVTLTGVSISDPMFITLSCTQPVTLAPGASLTCTGSHTVTQADLNAGTVENTANATGKDPSNAPIDALPANETVEAIQYPHITVNKSTPTTIYDHVGQLITYTLVATNDGNVTLHNVSITDPKLGALTCTQPVALAPGETLTCTGSHTITQADLDAGFYGNTATANGSGPQDQPVSDEASTSVNADQNPHMTLTKHADKTSYNAVGQVIHYTLEVTNDGNVTLTGVSISDAMFGTLSCTPTQPTTLAPTQKLTCTASHTVTQADLDSGSLVNTANAAGTSPDGTVIEPPAVEVTVPAVQNPHMTLVKSTTTTSFNHVDQVINYTLVATNDGNVTLSNVMISDPKLGTLTCTMGGNPVSQPVTLVPGASLRCTGSHTVTQADLDAGFYGNTAAVNGIEPGGQPVSDEDNKTVDAVQNPHIALTKTTTTTSFDHVGQVISYTLTATNNGNVTLYGVSISDPKLGTLTCNPSQPASLAPGASLTCKGNHSVTQADLDAGKFDNTGSATGKGPQEQPVSDVASKSVPAVQNKSFSLAKTGNLDMTVVAPTTRADVGDKINYTITLTNDGNVTLTGVTIVDAKLGTLACTPAQPATLAPGASLVCTGSYTLLQSDINAGTVHNVATGDSDQTVPTDKPNDVTVPKVSHFTLTKVGVLDMTVVLPNDRANVGDKINYTITLTNDGNVTLTGVTVVDSKASPLSCKIDGVAAISPFTLLPGKAVVCTGSYTLLQSDINAGTVHNIATGDSDQTVPTVKPNDVTVPQVPHFTLVKVGVLDMTAIAPPTRADAGDKINYTITLTNDGNVTLTGVTVIDTKVTSLSCKIDGVAATSPFTLLPGKAVVCTGRYTLLQSDINAGTVHNIATGDSDQTLPTDTPNDVTLPQMPHISLTKATTTTRYDHVGQVIFYTLVATNDGNVTLHDVSIVDPKLGTLTCTQPATLVPGAKLTCTGSHTVTLADLEAGKYDNTATVTGKGPQEQPVSATASASVPGVQIPKIDVEKYVKNGVGAWQDADTVTGPYLNPGVNPEFKFVVTNTGNVSLTGVTLVDNMLSLSGCTIPATLAPNASFECLVTGTWAAGQHTNTATATGTYNAAPTSDTDPANYFGVEPVVSKTANGTYQEVHDWQVFKSVDAKSQNAYAGQKVNFTWTVSVDETTRSENYLVTGVIKVVNPNPDDPMTMSLNDVLDDGAVATIGPCTGGTWSSPNLTVPMGSTATCNYSVTPKGELNALADALPDTVTINLHHGSDSWFVTTITNGGSLDGTSEGWCADSGHGIQMDKDYTANVFSSYESLPAGLVGHPENFDLVNWIINQHFVGKSAGGSLGNYTMQDVQQAIWELIDYDIYYSIPYNSARVAQIKALAAAHEGFTPTCGDLVAIILQPVGGKQISITQVTFASLGVDCAKSNAVLAVVNGVKFPASAEILWTANPVNPTATLDDSQNPAWPTTVSADATFTYKDPQGYTCPADPTTYTNGPTTYNASNKAVLTFSTGSVTSTASTTVKCDAYMPALTLVKSATPATYSQLGDVINYSYLVKNTGNVTLAGPVTVTDDKTSVTCPAGGLAPNTKMTCSATYTITQADLDYGLVENTAFASANGTISNTDDETVNLLKLTQTIKVTTHAPVSAAFLSSFTVAATGGASGNPIVYSASGACTNSGADFTMTSATGTCIVHYNQAGNSGFEAAPEITEVVGATKAAQTILVTTHAPASAAYNSSFTVAATSGSGLTVAYSASGACTNSAADFIMTSGTGTCAIHYNQVGNAYYFAAPEVTEVVSATKQAQVITFNTTAPLDATYGGAKYNPSISATSSLSVTITVDATASSVCSISSGEVSFIGVGTCVLDADQGGNANYAAASQVQQSFTVAKATLTVTAIGIDKVYDSTTTASVTLTDNRVAGDSITNSYTTASFLTADAGTGKTINVSGISISGADIGKYILGNTTAIATANITPADTTTVITNADALATDTVVGQSYQVTFSITSMVGVPTGSVTVSDGTDTCVGTVASGMCNLISTTAGTKSLTATFTGNGNFGGSVSITVLHTVNGAPAIPYWIYLPFVIR